MAFLFIIMFLTGRKCSLGVLYGSEHFLRSFMIAFLSHWNRSWSFCRGICLDHVISFVSNFYFNAIGLPKTYTEICCCSGEENGRQPSRLEWKIVEQQQ